MRMITVASTKRWLVIVLALAVCEIAMAATYYIDPVSGGDGNSGSAATPWRTVTYALKSVAPGDTVNLLPGDYGSVDFCPWGVVRATSWAAPITFQNDPDSPPHSARFTDIKMNQSYNMYYRLIGFKFAEPNVGTCVYGVYASHVQILDFVIHGNEGATTGPSLYAIWWREADDIIVEGCEIYHTRAVALEFGGCTNATARGNWVHDVTGSALRSGGGSDLLFEYNRIEDQRPEWEPGVHGSGLSMHSSNTTVRGNIVRNFGNTRPIRWYQDVAGDYGYSNLLIENNLTYDNYAWAPEFIDMGSDCIFRNNTFIGGAKVQFARLVDGSGLHIYNNVVTGSLYVDNYGTSAELQGQTRAEAAAKWPNVHEGNNIIEGLVASGGGYQLFFGEFQPADGNLILRNDSGAYKSGYDASFFNVGGFFASASGVYPYQLVASSAAVDFADPVQAAPTDLLGIPRNLMPDAGAYEYTTPGDIDGDGDVDLDDFVILKQNFGAADATRAQGDLDTDGDVDLDDFVILKSNFGG